MYSQCWLGVPAATWAAPGARAACARRAARAAQRAPLAPRPAARSPPATLRQPRCGAAPATASLASLCCSRCQTRTLPPTRENILMLKSLYSFCNRKTIFSDEESMIIFYSFLLWRRIKQNFIILLVMSRFPDVGFSLESYEPSFYS